MILKLKNSKIRVSLFIEPLLPIVESAFLLGADCVELHVGKFCRMINNNKYSKTINIILLSIPFRLKNPCGSKKTKPDIDFNFSSLDQGIIVLPFR